jgi:hypothetical protein
MAVWRIWREGSTVTLTYRESTRIGREKKRAEVPLSLENYLESWAGEEASAWDAIVTPRGTFFRQVGRETAFYRA